jgi:hypothetical protein
MEDGASISAPSSILEPPRVYCSHMIRVRVQAAAIFLLFLPGCLQRIVTIKSDPPGALVTMNGQEMGRTPVSREFLWYGNYDVELRLEGYQAIKTSANLGCPPWQYIPLDFFTDMLPIKDEHNWYFKLEPQPVVDPLEVLSRGEELGQMLESGSLTKSRPPTTRPSTVPAH